MSTGKSKAAAHGDEFARSARAAKYILSKTKLRPKIGIVLGTGLGSFADELASPTHIPYAKIPGFPRSTVDGHTGRLVIGKIENIPVAAMQGRVHLYEGYAVKDVAFPMRVFRQMGIRAAILTNAAGAINLDYAEGALVMIRDHINLQGANALVGPNDKRFGVRFPDMTQAYTKSYREIALAEAKRLGIAQHEGIYAAMLGAKLRNASGNPLPESDRRRSGRHVDRAGSDRRAPHGHSRPRNFLRHECRRRNPRP